MNTEETLDKANRRIHTKKTGFFTCFSTSYPQEEKKGVRTEVLTPLSTSFIRKKADLTEKNLPVIIDGKDRLAFRTPKPARLGRLEFLRADRAGKDLREDLGFDLDAARAEEVDRIGERILNIEELGEAKELKYLINLRLDLQKDDIAPLRLYGFQEGGKRPDTGG